MPNLTINGVVYPFPDVGTRPWAAKIISWATAVTNGMLQKSGGAFTLTAELNFGASYGIKVLSVKSQGTTPASSGVLRLANNEEIAWRDNPRRERATVRPDDHAEPIRQLIANVRRGLKCDRAGHSELIQQRSNSGVRSHPPCAGVTPGRGGDKQQAGAGRCAKGAASGVQCSCRP